MHDQTAQRSATLAGGTHGAEQDAAHGQVQIGTRGQDHGVVAAELEDAATETRSDPRADLAAHAGTAGGADQRHARVIDQSLTGVTVADDQLAQALWRIAEGLKGLFKQGLASQCSQRSFFRRLPDHSVTANQRQRSVPGPDRYGEVESADNTDHTQRVPGFTHMVARALRSDGQAIELARQAHGEIADIDHFLHFTQAFLGDLAGFEGNQFAQLSLVLTQDFTEQANQLTATRCRHIAPGSKGLLGNLDLAQYLGLAFEGDRGNRAAIDGGVNGMVAVGIGSGRYTQALQQSINHFLLLHLMSG
ncbi:hypothetical protein D3C76_1024850 [compost metagenome]